MGRAEIFTASLSQVVDHYRGKPAVTHTLYTACGRCSTPEAQPSKAVCTSPLSAIPSSRQSSQQIEDFPLPGCIRRLEVRVPDGSATIAAYTMAERDAGGQPRCGLVTSWDDLATLRLDPAGTPSEPELQPLLQRLRDVAWQEFAMTRVGPRIEALKERAGRSQLQPDYLMCYGLLPSRQQTGVAELLFWREMQAITAWLPLIFVRLFETARTNPSLILVPLQWGGDSSMPDVMLIEALLGAPWTMPLLVAVVGLSEV